MPGQINATQRYGVTAWRGTVTKENHIYNLFRANPQKASDVMVTLMSFMHLPTLNTYLSKEIPVREYDDDSELFWKVIGSSRRNIPLVEARRANGSVVAASDTDNVGVGFEPFYLVFGTDWFSQGEILWGNLNEVYPMIVKEPGKQEGTNTVYCVEPFGANGAAGIPVARLLAGEKFSWGYQPVERNLSRKVGDVRFTSPVAMSADWQNLRKQYKAGGKDLDRLVDCKIPVTNKEGKTITVDRWMHYALWKFEEEWEEEKTNALDRGVSTRMDNGEYSNFGLSGLPNKQGMGFRQLLATGNQRYYNKFSLALIDNSLLAISAGKIDYKKRKFVMRTGEYGARQFSMAAKADLSGWLPVYGAIASQNMQFMSKGPETNFTNGNAATITNYQVTKWISPSGHEVTIMVDASKDDLQTNKVMHTLGGPAESYRYDIFYAADEDQPNVQKCKLKGTSEWRGYQWGPFRNPFDNSVNNMSASFDEDAAVMHVMATQGIVLYDPTRCISLIPALLQA